jgi:hypothetical protein
VAFLFYLTHMEKKEDKIIAQFTSYGLMAGVVIGAINDNVGLWIAIGVAIGAGLGFVKMEKRKDGLE